MSPPTLFLLISLITSAFAQNVTTTITTRVPVSTLATTLVQTSTTLASASTIFSTETLVSTFPTSTPTSTPEPSPVVLDTTIGPAFGVLGAVLILTGLPSAFWGHKNRWSSFFITGFYTLALVCLVLVLRFGVLQAINPPSEMLRGLFVLSSVVAGVVGGGISIFFWQGTKYFIGAWGGFALGLFIQCMDDGGVIKPLGFRYLLYIGCAVIGFVLCTLPRLHYQIILISTAMVGASAFMLGVDCYTTAGLKEFYVYNLGFRALFPKYADIVFPVSEVMKIEIGMMGAVAIMGAAVQARVLIELRARLREINAEQARRNAEVEAKASARLQEIEKERAQWEQEHGNGDTRKVDDVEVGRTMTPGSLRASSQFSLFKSNTMQAGRSSMTMADLNHQGAPKEEATPSPPLKLDLGGSVSQAIPDNLISSDIKSQLTSEERSHPDIQKNLALLNELEDIKKSLSAIKGGSDRPSSFAMGARPRASSTTAESTLANASKTVGTGSRLQPGHSAARPASTPILNEWDNYVSSRNLFQPPSGVTTPVTPITAPIRPHSISMSPAVIAALEARQQRERAYELGGPEAYFEASISSRDQGSRPISVMVRPSREGALSDDDVPLSHHRRVSSGANSTLQQHQRTRAGSQVVILPPKRHSPTQSTSQPTVKTFEELESRHREKMRALQEPLSKKEAEDAEIAAAKRRWERSTATEKNVMTQKEQQRNSRNLGSKGQLNSDGRVQRPHSRSFGASDRRERPLSTASKVQEWKKYQDATQHQLSNEGDNQTRSKSPLPSSSGRQTPHSRSGSLGDLIM